MKMKDPMVNIDLLDTGTNVSITLINLRKCYISTFLLKVVVISALATCERARE